jgi:eukaryotic-like serine/threonine-protein kinase
MGMLLPTNNHAQNLLFGLLGLQTGLLARDDLLAVVSTWLEDKSQSIEELLLAKNAIGNNECELLRSLVQVHLSRHAGDAEQSLGAISSIDSAVRDLHALGDADLQATLTIVQHANDAHTDNATRQSPPGSPPVTIQSGGKVDPQSRFKIIRPHAKGGLGEVSLAEDRELNREVALKEIQPRFADDSNSRSRFLQEAEITGRLEHPGIVPVYGLGQYADGRPYYAMRFIRGDSLQEAALQFHQRLSNQEQAASEAGTASRKQYSIETVEFRKLLGRFIDVCNAIAYANARGVLHRDLKPGNIMLGQYGETLVVDWGLAKALGYSDEALIDGEHTLLPSSGSGSAPTQMGSAIGTPAYMPPEQAEGSLEKMGPASDVYSLGATMYFLITGRPPVQGKSVAEILTKVRSGDVAFPTSINPGIPKPLAAICMRAMATNPEDRYAKPQELADEIERYLADEPTLAFVESYTVRVRRWTRKHPRLVASMAASLLVGLTSTLVIATVISGKNGQLSAANAELDNVNIELGIKNDQLLLAVDREREATRNAQERQMEAETAVRLESIATAKAIASRQEAVKSQEQAELDRMIAEEARREAVQRQLETEAARAQEVLAKEEAEARRQEAERVLVFFTDRVVAAARPQDQDGGLGNTATIRDAIEVAVGHITEDFAGLPMAEASVRRTIGTSYTFLGEYQRAIEQLKQAIELCEAAVGRQHEKTMFSMNELALAYKYAGDQDNSFRLYEELLECIKLNYGNEHEDLLTYTNNLGEAYRAAGRLDRALPMLTETLRLRKSVLGPQHPHTLTTMNNLAMAIEDAGNRAEALPLFEETLRLRREELSPTHPLTLQSMNNLAAAYVEDGRHEDAKKLHEEALRMLIDTLGQDHPSTLNSMNNLGKALLELGQTEEAIAKYRQALTGRGKQLGEFHPETMQTLLNLANALLIDKQSDEAIAMVNQRMKDLDNETQITPPRRAQFLLRASDLLVKHELYEAAMPHLDNCVKLCEKAEVEAWILPAVQGMQGLTLAASQEYPKAEALLIAGYEGLEPWRSKLPVTDAIRLSIIAQSLVNIYEAQNQPQQVSQWQAKLEALNTASSE